MRSATSKGPCERGEKLDKRPPVQQIAERRLSSGNVYAASSPEQQDTMKIRYAYMLCAVLVAIPLAAGADEIYKVRKGDNLSRIAKRFHVKAERIMEANGLDSDLLKPGKRLSIPTGSAKAAVSRKPEPAVDNNAAAGAIAPETCLHTVEPGETLSSIADMYGMSVKGLKALNHIRRPRKLRAGARILVNRPDMEPAVALPSPDPAAEARLALELKELAASPSVKEAGNPTEPGKRTAVGAIKEKLIRIAQKMLDIPYRFGGSSFLGIDCSGFVQKVYGLLDVMLPRTAREQFSHGEVIEKENLSAGDLVFFRTYAKYPSHVGIYLGNNEFIHASSKDRRVKIDSLDAPYYYKRFLGARRLPLDGQANEI